ncbi:ImmA/IrrE family metallo-endopeptidase [Ochrobactrum sp. GRS2]|nr:ImmA/IrrE family metallo-endopeptidase [Ochrobactrum sp. GRS2]
MAIIRRQKSPESIIRRAHLGNVENPKDLINLAKKNNLSTQPLDVDGLFKALNIPVIYSDTLNADVSGHLMKTENGWQCTINANHHPTRQRFTLAHELGHYILHRNQKTDFVDHTYFRKGDALDTMEFEANAFAAEVLMPSDAFAYYIENISSDVNDIANHFGVSPLAVSVRSKQLRLRD